MWFKVDKTIPYATRSAASASGRTRSSFATNATQRDTMGPPYYAAHNRGTYQNVASISETHRSVHVSDRLALWAVCRRLRLPSLNKFAQTMMHPKLNGIELGTQELSSLFFQFREFFSHWESHFQERKRCQSAGRNRAVA